MLVDVVVLRERGAKLPREVVLGASPRRGHLSVIRSHAGYPRCAFLTHRAEQLTASNKASVLPPLNDVVLTRLALDSFVLAGIETVENFSQPLRFAQAWWCRVVRE